MLYAVAAIGALAVVAAIALMMMRRRPRGVDGPRENEAFRTPTLLTPHASNTAQIADRAAKSSGSRVAARPPVAKPPQAEPPQNPSSRVAPGGLAPDALPAALVRAPTDAPTDADAPLSAPASVSWQRVQRPLATGSPGYAPAVDDVDEPSGPQALILVTAGARTDPGLKRKHNEDAFGVLQNHRIFVIADGMGRHAAGEVASRLCIETIEECFKTESFGASPPDPRLPARANRLRGAILEANRRILRASEERDAYHGMGTTVVAAYFSPSHQRVYVAHVGDSRCYRFRDGALQQLTTDHTLGAAGLAGRNAAMLSRAVGIEPDLDVDVTIESPRPDDMYLLCSDGLSRMVPDAELGTVLSQQRNDLEAATKRLIDLANERGGRDNVTTVLVRVDAPS